MKQLRLIVCLWALSTAALFVYGVLLSASAAYAKPSLSIVQPVHGAVVSGKVAIVVAYRSTTGTAVTHLELWVDKQLAKAVKLDNPSTEGTYTFTWDTDALPTGLHNVTAIAYDAQNTFADAAISLYKQEALALQPVVTLEGVQEGQVISGVVPLSANVLDSLGARLMVMFFLNNRLLAGTNIPPYRYSWDTSRVPNGPHTLRAEAWDGTANLGQSPSITVYVDNPGGRTRLAERPSSAAPPTTPSPAGPVAAAPTRPHLIPQSARVTLPAPAPRSAVTTPAPQSAPAVSSTPPAAPAAAKPELALTLGTPTLDRVAMAPLPERAPAFLPAAPTQELGAGGRLVTPSMRPVVSTGTKAPGEQVALAMPESTPAVFSPAASRALQPQDVSARPRLSGSAAPSGSVLAVEAARRASVPSEPQSPPFADAEIVAMPGTLTVPPAPVAGQPALSSPTREPGVMIALADRKKEHILPIAVVLPRHAEPAAARPSLPDGVSPAPPVKRLVLSVPGKGTLTMVYNGRPVRFPDVQPFSRDGMALAPFRYIFEHEGGTVLWEHFLKQVIAHGNGRQIEFRIGHSQATVNGQSVTLEVAPFIKEGRSIVPLSFVRDALDVTVDYDPASGRITIAAR